MKSILEWMCFGGVNTACEVMKHVIAAIDQRFDIDAEVEVTPPLDELNVWSYSLEV